MNCSLVFLWRLYKLHRRVHPRSLSATAARFLRTLATWKGSTVGARRPRPQWWCGNNRDWLGQKVTGLNSSTDKRIFSTKSLFCEIMFLPSQSLLLWRQLWDVKSNRSHKQVRDVIGSHSLKDPSVRWQKKLFRKFWEKKIICLRRVRTHDLFKTKHDVFQGVMASAAAPCRSPRRAPSALLATTSAWKFDFDA